MAVITSRGLRSPVNYILIGNSMAFGDLGLTGGNRLVVAFVLNLVLLPGVQPKRYPRSQNLQYSPPDGPPVLDVCYITAGTLLDNLSVSLEVLITDSQNLMEFCYGVHQSTLCRTQNARR